MSGLSHELVEHEFNLVKAQEARVDKRIADDVEYRKNYRDIIAIREASKKG